MCPESTDRHSKDNVQMLIRLPYELKRDLGIITAALGISATAGVSQATAEWVERQRSSPEVTAVLGSFATQQEP